MCERANKVVTIIIARTFCHLYGQNNSIGNLYAPEMWKKIIVLKWNCRHVQKGNNTLDVILQGAVNNKWWF